MVVMPRALGAALALTALISCAPAKAREEKIRMGENLLSVPRGYLDVPVEYSEKFDGFKVTSGFLAAFSLPDLIPLSEVPRDRVVYNGYGNRVYAHIIYTPIGSSLSLTRTRELIEDGSVTLDERSIDQARVRTIITGTSVFPPRALSDYTMYPDGSILICERKAGKVVRPSCKYYFPHANMSVKLSFDREEVAQHQRLRSAVVDLLDQWLAKP